MAPSDRPRVRPTPPPDSTELRLPRILVADDDRASREALASCLRSGGYLIEAFESGQEVLDRAMQGGIDLVLLDVLMPRLSGLETCRMLKAIGAEAFVPVVLVTAKTDTASRVEGLRIGADDYICKPVEELELLARVSAMLRIKRMYDEVAAQRTRLRKLTVHDELTGLYNQRFVHVRLSEEFKRAERYHEPFACMMIDIDPMRSMSPSGGWVTDDGLIKTVADRVRRSVREVDMVARYTSDAFLVVLPSTHFAGSLAVAERIWREITEQSIEAEGVLRKVTVSIGIALYPSMDVRTKEALIKAAEEALAQAKRAGGNRICAFQQQGYIYTPPIGGGVGASTGGPPSSRRGGDMSSSVASGRERSNQASTQRVSGPDVPQDSRRKPI